MDNLESLDSKQISEVFHVTSRTIYNWRKGNPNFPKAIPTGRKNLYRKIDIQQFIESEVA